jgi:hypothetical protein
VIIEKQWGGGREKLRLNAITAGLSTEALGGKKYMLCLMKQKAKARRNGHSHIGRGSLPLQRRVRAMAAAGLVEDQIALRLGGMDKNKLRKDYVDVIKQGRAKLKRQKAEAGELTFAEMCAADAILSAVNSHWQTPEHGNLIFQGLADHGARDAIQAYARWLRDGGRWITAGIRKNFSPERIAEFVALKREAQALLGKTASGGYYSECSNRLKGQA